jgi:putative FmdB family regulatory protein
MPTYEYRCRKYGRRFEKAMTFKQHERGTKPACLKCKSRNVEQLPSQFQAVTGKKT